MSETLLEVKELCVKFSTEDGDVTAVDHISFDVNKGEIIGIVGESGSGKSMTSLSVMQLVPYPGRLTSGTINYNVAADKTVDLAQLPEKDMQDFRGNEIAMIFQEPMTSLNPVFTCGMQVMEAIILHQHISKSEAAARTVALFKKVGLPDPEAMLKRYPHQLSGGQKQRVMIALAMSCNPSLLIADEPTTALDVTVQKNILELIKKLQHEQGMSVIFITHDLGVIAEIADRVMVMYKGKIVESGSAKEIFRNPQHPYTQGLLACRPPLGKKLNRLPVVADFMETTTAGELLNKGKTIDQLEDISIISEAASYERLQLLEQQAPILTVKDLNTWFPAQKSFLGKPLSWVKAVNNVSFDVKPGETLGLVGESGCGKTTLGRSVLRLIEPKSGMINYKGRELRDYSSRQLRRFRKEMQLIFQDPYSSLNPRLTIGSAITEPMKVHGMYGSDKERRRIALDLLERVGLQARQYGRYPHEFSGGQRQRICIARALALKPDFIICDESVSALDVSVQAQVLNLLLELQREYNLTYIFISHDLSVVKFMSDRLIVMNKGQIEEMGSAEDIYKNPQSDYTKKLIDAIPGAT